MSQISTNAAGERLKHHKVSWRLLEVVGVDMFSLYNKTYICIVDYHSKFPVIKKAGSLSANNLILAYKVIFFREWTMQENTVRSRW